MLGIKALIQEKVSAFPSGLAGRKDEVKRRCRTALQSRSECLMRDSLPSFGYSTNAYATLAPI